MQSIKLKTAMQCGQQGPGENSKQTGSRSAFVFDLDLGKTNIPREGKLVSGYLKKSQESQASGCGTPLKYCFVYCCYLIFVGGRGERERAIKA